uniref:snRNA-activating protein complex subunit 3 n=1 Tax=Caenorhabditis japonica TaxID=281687 RepID=A0A8R1E3U7_CAEJA
MSMDILLKADEQPFVSPVVSFRNFIYFAKMSKEEDDKVAGTLEAVENIRKNENLSPGIAENLMRVLDVSDLQVKMFNRETDSGLERNQLTSQKIMIRENSKRRNAQCRSIAQRALRYDHINQKALARKSPHLKSCQKGTEVEKSEEIFDLDLEKDMVINNLYNDLIISISIYFGYCRELEYHEIRLGRLMKVTDRLELTGSHTLLDLKNAFSCPADYAFSEDFSEKQPTVADFAKNKYPSAMFFIHDTFYIEPNEKPGCEESDPSSHIRKWAETRNYIGPMHVALMAEKKLGDLFCRLGQPYVFIHQAGCEHLIVFNDLFMRDESHQGVEFPRRLIERNFRRIACDTCKDASAQWMIVDHENLLPNSPGYLCSACYTEFCFDVNGNKVCEFKAVPYCDRKEVGDGGKFISELRFESAQK